MNTTVPSEQNALRDHRQIGVRLFSQGTTQHDAIAVAFSATLADLDQARQELTAVRTSHAATFAQTHDSISALQADNN